MAAITPHSLAPFALIFPKGSRNRGLRKAVKFSSVLFVISALVVERNRDTVYEAIKALEAADILTWVNRFDKIPIQCRGAFGRVFTFWKYVTLSNAYCFRDPLPCATECDSYASENPPGTLNQKSSLLSYIDGSTKVVVLDPANSWQSALIGLGRACGAIGAAPAV